MADPYAAFASPDPYAGFASPRPNPIGASMAQPNAPPAPHELTSDIVNAIKETGAFFGDVAKNAPGDAYNIGKGVVDAVSHPIDTAKNLERLGTAVASKITSPVIGGMLDLIGTVAPERAADSRLNLDLQRQRVEAPVNALGQSIADDWGSVPKAINTIRTKPVSALLDASTVLGGGGSLLAKAPGIGGKVGEVMTAAGRVIDPVTQTGNALVGAGKIIEPIVSNALGVTTGTGKDAVRLAAGAGREGGTAGESFRANMRGDVPISDIVDRAKEAVGELRKDRAAAYKAGKADLSKDATVLDFNDIDKAVSRASEVGEYRGRSGTGPAQVTEPKAVGITKEMTDVVDAWKKLDPAEFHTPEGMDALKRALGNIRDSAPYGSPERVAAERIYKAVREEVATQVPAYSKMMEDYAKASDQLKETTRTFSLGEKATGDTAARKLLSATRNNVQTNFGERGRLLNALAEKAPDLPYAIAGQAMNSPVPRGLVGRAMLPIEALSIAHNPLAIPMMAASSPRLVGETAHLAGRAVGGVEDAMNALHINPANVRAAERAAYQTEQLGAPDNVGAMALAYRKALERRNALAR